MVLGEVRFRRSRVLKEKGFEGLGLRRNRVERE